MVGKKGGKSNSFQCFVCHDKDISLDEYEMYKHKTLGVTICDTCKDQHMSDGKWHDSKEWCERDGKGKCIYCEICGEGGTLLPCDICEFSYCTNKCLKQWLGEKKLEELLEDEKIAFQCFPCLRDQKPDKVDKIFPNYAKFLQITDKQMGTSSKKKANRKRSYSSDEDDEPSISSDEPVERSTSIKGKRKQKEPSKQFTCYSCFGKQEMKPSKMPRMHIKTDFKIHICDSCYEYVDSDDWTFTDGKSDYCVISGEGGEIFSCDTDGCKNSFCAEIMEKYLGKVMYKKIADDDDAEFFCWVCKPSLGNYQKFAKQSADNMKAFDEPPQVAEEPIKKLTNGHGTPSKFKSPTKRSKPDPTPQKPTPKPEVKPEKVNQSGFRMPDTDSESSSDEEPMRVNTPPDDEKEAKEYYKKLLENSPVKKHVTTKVFKDLMATLD